jgi:membrane associated rhomboid family serine protease
MGTGRFVIFYLCCGVASGLAHTWVNASSQAPLVGASGAVAGVLVAYLMLYPRVRVFGLIFTWLPLVIPAWLFIGVWIVAQTVSAIFLGGGDIGWWAHIGGVVAGAALTPLFKQKDTPLFGAGPPQRFLAS